MAKQAPPYAQLEPQAYERLKARLKVRLADLVDRSTSPDRQPLLRETFEEPLRRAAHALSQELVGRALSPDDEARLLHEVIDEMVGLGPLEPLLADPAVSEVMINGPRQIFVERDGCLERLAPERTFRDAQHLLTVIERLLSPAGVGVNEAEPCVDAWLPGGLRANVVIPPIALNGPTVTLRKQARRFTMEDWIACGSISPQAARLLEACVKAHVNIIISGGTSSGKTTLVSVLSRSISPQERVITIENVAELELPCEHWVRLVARLGHADGRGEISLRALVKNALRMRPTRIILGEARGGEALDVVQAMLTGHDGVLTVLHASSPAAALERLQTLMLMSGLDLSAETCRQQIAQAVELIVHLAHCPDGTRRVERIVQVSGARPEGVVLEELWTLQWRGVADEQGGVQGVLEPTGVRPRFERKLEAHGMQLPEELFRHA
jgi:pilus assembly protein CpaF